MNIAKKSTNDDSELSDKSTALGNTTFKITKTEYGQQSETKEVTTTDGEEVKSVFGDTNIKKDSIGADKPDVYVIDEFQFLDGNVNCIEEMAESGKKFYIAGLNLTSERKPFGKMGDLLCVSDNVQTMTSICEICRRDNAVFSYYKAGKKNGDIKLGDLEYIPVCRNCYNELNKNKA